MALSSPGITIHLYLTRWRYSLHCVSNLYTGLIGEYEHKRVPFIISWQHANVTGWYASAGVWALSTWVASYRCVRQLLAVYLDCARF